MGKRVSAKRTAAERRALAERPIAEVAEHHPVIKDYLDKMATASELETLDMRLAISQILSGQEAILGNQRDQAAEIARLRAKFDAYDRDARKWDNDRAKFLEDVIAQGNKLKVKGEKLDRIKAKAANMYQEARVNARATVATERLALEQKLAAQPQVTVIAPGEIELRNTSMGPEPHVVPTVISIGHKRWVLQPGEPTVVPLAVKQQLDQRARSRQETAARKELLSGTIKDTSIQPKWDAINRQFGSAADGIPLASQV